MANIKTILKHWLLKYGKKNSAGRVAIRTAEAGESLTALFAAFQENNISVDDIEYNLIAISDIFVPTSTRELKVYKNSMSLNNTELKDKLRKWCRFFSFFVQEKIHETFNYQIDANNLYKKMLQRRGIIEYAAPLDEQEVDSFLESLGISEPSSAYPNPLSNKTDKVEKSSLFNNNIDWTKILIIDDDTLKECQELFPEPDPNALMFFGLDKVNKESL